jgi:hypothetical protein
MDVLGTPLRAVGDTLLDRLVAESIREDQRLEFKRLLPQPTPGDRVEFMKDVSAFANSRGGVILYGVAENGGVATVISGLGGINVDNEILRLEQTLQTGVQPRIAGLTMLPIQHPNGVILAVGIRRSLVAPHMVWANETGQFWGRNNAGKFLMDVTQVRQAMLAADAWERAAAQFRDARLQRIRAGLGLKGVPDGGVLVLHVLPIGGPRERVDLPRVKPDWQTALYMGSTSGGYTTRPNSEGWLVNSDNGARHFQVFRDGGGVEIRLDLSSFRSRTTTSTGQILVGNAVEFQVARWAKMAFLWLAAAEVEPPYALFLSMLNVEHTRFSNNNAATMLLNGDYEIDVPDVLLSEQLLDALPDDVGNVLAPTFDAMWQAASWPKSAARDHNGVVQYAAELAAVRWP